MNAALIEQLARLRGIGDAYHDYRGDLHHFSLQTKADLLTAMGCNVEDDATLAEQIHAIQTRRSRGLLPEIAVSSGERLTLDVNVTAREFGSSLIWRLQLENGVEHEGVFATTALHETWRGEIDGVWMTKRRVEFSVDVPAGHHDLEARISGGAAYRCRVIVAPPRCFQPAEIQRGDRLWGVALQLYTLRSARNLGMGDFGDLNAVIRWLAPLGADFIALNPLHSLAPGDPQRCSPYSASNRNFLNVMYIAPEGVPEFDECAAAQERCAADDFRTRAAELRAFDRVDYRGVAELKFDLLRILHAHFRAHHLDKESARARRFRDFVAAGGESLRLHALFDALDAHCIALYGGGSGWQQWPTQYSSPDTVAVKHFAHEHAERVEFHLYTQWLAHEQLLDAQSLARSSGMRIGLYGDFAVGTHPSGSEVWMQQSSFRLGAEIGAPPDPLALKGQGWGIPPQDPRALESERLTTFAALLKNNMRYYGALRFDHVMALFRQWWVPGGQSPAAGAYVHYPMQELMAALSLESNRRRCLVVGEDLGVVPDEIRAAMPRYGLLHYKVLLFEKLDGRFRRPDEFEPSALATPSTHDMPTLSSYWEGRDIELRERLNLYPDAHTRDAVMNEREQDRHLLLAALTAEGLLPDQPRRTSDAFSMALADSIHLYLGRSASALAALQIEDLLGMVDPVNVPGTYWEYPNWQRKVSAGIEEIAVRTDVNDLLKRVDAERRRGAA